jgi:energy-coupling factor transport system permease protein
VLDRALDVAAALEVRGYGSARRTPRGAALSPPWSRHDLAFTAAAIAITSLAVGGRIAGLEPFSSDSALHAPVSAGGLAVATGLLVCALLPFADRRGVER